MFFFCFKFGSERSDVRVFIFPPVGLRSFVKQNDPATNLQKKKVPFANKRVIFAFPQEFALKRIKNK